MVGLLRRHARQQHGQALRPAALEYVSNLRPAVAVNDVVFEHQSWIFDLWGDSVVRGVRECCATMASVADVLRVLRGKRVTVSISAPSSCIPAAALCCGLIHGMHFCIS